MIKDTRLSSHIHLPDLEQGSLGMRLILTRASWLGRRCVDVGKRGLSGHALPFTKSATPPNVCLTSFYVGAVKIEGLGMRLGGTHKLLMLTRSHSGIP